MKNLYQPSSDEYKIVYVLAGLDKKKIQCALSEEEINKIILNEE